MRNDNWLLIIIIFLMAFSASVKNLLQDDRIEKIEARCTALEKNYE